MSLSAVPIGGLAGSFLTHLSLRRPTGALLVLLSASVDKFSHGVPLPRVAWGCLVVVTRMQAGSTVEYSSTTTGAREDLRQ